MPNPQVYDACYSYGVINFGDSISYTPTIDSLLSIQGLPPASPTGTIPARGVLALDYADAAVGGTTCKQWDEGAVFTAFSSNVSFALAMPPFYRASRTHNIAGITCGVNDALGSETAVQVYSHITSLVVKLQAAHFDGVIVNTVTDSSQGNANTSWRTDLNTLIRNGAIMYGYTVSDPGGDSLLGCTDCYMNLTYFNVDGVHPTAAGYAIYVASYLKPALVSLGVP